MTSFVYSTGTVSVSAGGSLFTGSSTAWVSALIQPGDEVHVEGQSAIAIVDSVDAEGEITPVLPWAGDAVSGAAYVIFRTSFKYSDAGQVSQFALDMLAQIRNASVFYVVSGSAPDPSIGEEGHYAVKTNATPWTWWVRTGGAWVETASPFPLQVQGGFAESTPYAVGDLVTYDGSVYYSLQDDNLGNIPSEGSGYWELFIAGGVEGPPGLDGAAVLNGTGAPSSSVGIDDDFYIDTAAYDIYGPKAAGAWPGVGVSLVGPQGDPGDPGADGNTVLYGSGAPGGGTGVDGDFYIDTSAHDIYGPKASGSWPAGTSLVGPAGSASSSSTFILSGILTPSQITVNQNDYAPTGYATATVFRLSSDASRDITGFAAGSTGQVAIFHNVGAQNIVLKDESAWSTAANRFALTADLTLAADAVAILQYDGTSQRWRVVSGGGGGGVTSITAGVGLSGGTITSTGTINVQLPLFQCQLNKSGSNLALTRYNGKYLFINGANEVIPSGGVTLAAPSETITMTIASPAVVSLTGHGLASGDVVKFSTSGALPTGVTANQTYYVISAGLTADAFEFSASPGGSAVNTSGSQSGTHKISRRRYIYAYMSVGTMTLEASATAPTADTTYGHKIKTGDATRTLVGMAFDVAAAWVDSALQRLVLSYYNRRGIVGTVTSIDTSSTTSASFVAINSTNKLEFLTWGDEAVIQNASGILNNSTTAGMSFTVGLDGTADTSARTQLNGGNANMQTPMSTTAVNSVAEGYHYAQTWAASVTAGNTTTIFTNWSNILVRG